MATLTAPSTRAFGTVHASAKPASARAVEAVSARARIPAPRKPAVLSAGRRSAGPVPAGLASPSSSSRAARLITQAAVTSSAQAATSREGEVLRALEKIIDPDFGMNIVECGFIKNVTIGDDGRVAFTMELTTPACPIKDEFQRDAEQFVADIEWVNGVSVNMTAQPPSLPTVDENSGLRKVANIIAVSSCKGGVGKSTVSVNLAYSLAMMGAKVGIFDADVYGPSLPTMISPEIDVLQMDAETKEITPVEYEGVKVVSFGFAGQQAAIMRGPMVSGVINQLLTTTDWGELDYLVIDFPPGTGDIQLTLCQVVPITAAVIVTTPQKLAFIDVAKGVRMFAKLQVPCVGVVENMSYFEVDGTKHYPFGTGSGQRVVDDFAIPNLFQMPIKPELSAAGDNGRPHVIDDPTGEVAGRYQELGASVVREVSKLKRAARNAVRYDAELAALVCRPPTVDGEPEEFLLDPATVRRNDQSAASIDEWTGAPILDPRTIPDNIKPESIVPLGNYAVQITWDDGFNQVAPFDQLSSMERLIPPAGGWEERVAAVAAAGGGAGADEGLSNAEKILKGAQPR